MERSKVPENTLVNHLSTYVDNFSRSTFIERIMQTTMWGEVLAKLEKRINRPSFNTWIKEYSDALNESEKVNIGVA